jgi:hypothetical protein
MSDEADADDLCEANEPDEVLAVLRDLLRRVRHPVVRACLEGAVEDIEHLVGGEGDGLDGPG